jgi:hypothetical protein
MLLTRNELRKVRTPDRGSLSHPETQRELNSRMGIRPLRTGGALWVAVRSASEGYTKKELPNLQARIAGSIIRRASRRVGFCPEELMRFAQFTRAPS